MFLSSWETEDWEMDQEAFEIGLYFGEMVCNYSWLGYVPNHFQNQFEVVKPVDLIYTNKMFNVSAFQMFLIRHRHSAITGGERDAEIVRE